MGLSSVSCRRGATTSHCFCVYHLCVCVCVLYFVMLNDFCKNQSVLSASHRLDCVIMSGRELLIIQQTNNEPNWLDSSWERKNYISYKRDDLFWWRDKWNLEEISRCCLLLLLSLRHHRDATTNLHTISCIVRWPKTIHRSWPRLRFVKFASASRHLARRYQRHFRPAAFMCRAPPTLSISPTDYYYYYWAKIALTRDLQTIIVVMWQDDFSRRQ